MEVGQQSERCRIRFAIRKRPPQNLVCKGYSTTQGRLTEKRRLRSDSKTALFCCGSERTLHGETAAEEIGVRPIPVW